MVELKHVVCPIDFSDRSIRALTCGSAFATKYAAQLEYMDPEEPCARVFFDIRRRRQYFIDHARPGVHPQLVQEPTPSCEIDEVVAIDRAFKAVLHHAEASKADLIVMGAQGTGALELMLHGRTHDRCCVRHCARCSPFTPEQKPIAAS